MKAILTFLILAFLLPINAQECSKYYMQTPGKQLLIYQYDKRGRHELTTVYQVKEVIPEAGGHRLLIDMQLLDAKKRNELIVQGGFEAICSLGSTSIEPRSMLAPGLFEQYNDMEYEIAGDNLTMPNDLEVGQLLPEAQVTMKVNVGGIGIKTQVIRKDQTIVRQETLTTPAGTFNCYVMTYTNILKVGLSKTYYTTVWLAEGIGMVKEETRKANGRLVTYSVLNNISDIE